MKPNDSDQYISLITSLPNPTGLFRAKTPPLSRIKLEKRLQELTPEHKRILVAVEDILDWRQMHADITQQEVLKRGKHAMANIHNPTLKMLVQVRLEMRTFLLALRMREQGLPAPTEKNWGFGRWQQHIVRHWNEPAFQLNNVFDWVLNAESLLKTNQPFKLEQLLLDIAFTQLIRAGARHLFDFEAVVIYVLKWNIVNRTVKYNSHVASKRFKALLSDTLKQSQGDIPCLANLSV